MIVLDPVTLGDAAFSRASPKWVYDKTGTLVEVPVNVPAVTYDPADLSKAPYVLIEPAATNVFANSEDFAGPVWTRAGISSADVTTAPGDASTCTKLVENQASSVHQIYAVHAQTDGGGVAFAVDVRPAGRNRIFFGGGWIFNEVAVDLVTGAVSGAGAVTTECRPLPNGWWRVVFIGTPTSTIGYSYVIRLRDSAGNDSYAGDGSSGVYIRRAQLEAGDKATSYIPTTGAPTTRAADIIGTTAGLLYSNVAEVEPLWAPGAYALGAKVRDAAHIAYESLAAANTAPLTDPSKWLKLGATNRWAMFDDRNNTQTASDEEIVVALSPRAIAQGLLLGNVDASEVGIAVTVPNFGVVYRETASLVVPTSGRSFFRWAFNRIRRKTLFLSLNLPIFFNGVVTVSIRRPGGIAKCGMCLIGPTVEPGPALMGLSTEIKDYSTTSFNVDGSSSTIERGYRKLMSMDVSIDTEKIVEAEEQMIAWKQKTVAWVGAASRPDTVLVGRYSSFKKVIESYPRSKMALQIEGVLS